MKIFMFERFGFCCCYFVFWVVPGDSFARFFRPFSFNAHSSHELSVHAV